LSRRYQLNVNAKFPLHRDVLLQSLRLVRVNNAYEPGFTEVSGLAYDFTPVLEYLQTDDCELHLGRKAVVHPHQGGRASAATAADVFFFNDRNLSGAASRKLECNGGAHHAGAENYDVRDFGEAGVAVTHAAASLKRFLFQSRSTCCAALCPGAPVTPPPGCAPAPHKYNPAIGVRYCDHPATGRMKNNCSSVRSPWKMFPSVKP